MALSDNLSGVWTLDETSGTRSDSIASLDLADNNTVGYGTGKNSNAADFVSANSEYLRASGNLLPGNGASFTVSFWFKADTVSGEQGLVTVGDGGNPSQLAWAIYLDDTTLYVVFRQHFTSSASTATYSTISASTWYHVIGWWDASDGYAYVQVNGGTPNQGDNTFSTAQYTSSKDLAVGAQNQQYQNFDGLIDEVYIWNAALSSDDRSTLYNSGTGTFYPFSSGYSMTLEPGSYTLSGTALTPTQDRQETLGAGSYSLSGTSLSPLLGRVPLGLEAGSYSLSGTALTPTQDRVLVPEAGSISLSGTALTPTQDRTVALGAGSFTLSGTALTVTYDRTLELGAGAYVISGTDVTLTYTGDLGYTIDLEAGAYSLSGTALTPLHDRASDLGAGSYSLSGTALTPTHDRVVVVAAGSFSLSGTALSPLYNRSMDVEAGSYSISGTAVGLLQDRTLVLDAGTINLTGKAVTLTWSGGEVETDEGPGHGVWGHSPRGYGGGGLPGVTR